MPGTTVRQNNKCREIKKNKLVVAGIVVGRAVRSHSARKILA